MFFVKYNSPQVCLYIHQKSDVFQPYLGKQRYKQTYALRNVNSVISGSIPMRSGGPTTPTPRLTYNC